MTRTKEGEPMKKYLRDGQGLAAASITIRADGQARLLIRDCYGRKQHDKLHKNEKAARSAWYR